MRLLPFLSLMAFCFTAMPTASASYHPPKAPIKPGTYKIQDKAGRITGTLKVQGNNGTIRDSQGRITGTLKIQGNRIEQRDSQGRRK